MDSHTHAAVAIAGLIAGQPDASSSFGPAASAKGDRWVT